MTKGNGKAKKKGSENSDDNSDPGMVIPTHGNGALLKGGLPGNRGGPGAVPSAIREYCRGSFAQRVPILEAIADGEVMERMLLEGTDKELEVMKSAKVVDRIKAIDVLAKYGGVDKIALTVDEQPEDEMTPERRLALWETMKRLRTLEEFEKVLVGAAKKQVGDGG